MTQATTPSDTQDHQLQQARQPRHPQQSRQSRQSGKTRSCVYTYDYETAGRGPIRWSLLIIAPFLLILGGWAGFAPINAAAIAAGEVVLNQERKTIQHLEGGLVDDILISEGATIRRGEPILIIRDIAQRARMNTLFEQLASARVLHARLSAERDGANNIDFAALEDQIGLPASKFDNLRTAQGKLFQSRKKTLGAKVDLIESRKVSVREEIEGLDYQVTAAKTRLDLNAHELVTVEELYRQKLVTMNRMMILEREEAEIRGEIGALGASIARLKQSIVAADIEIIDLESEAQNAVLQELQQAELQVQELTHQMRETSDQLERTVIRAPVEGVVMDLQVHTKGAVVQPGQRILDIVPNDDRLIIEARLNPNDIDLVTTGTNAKVLLSAYKAKKVPKLDAEVLGVSADILSDQATGERYFLARVLVHDEVLKDLHANVALYPGMPAQVFFLAGERTVADYLLSPVIDATYRAFREE